MKIYVIHASSYDFRQKLYEPLLEWNKTRGHELTLPHQHIAAGIASYELIQQTDIVIAEVSYPSTGSGMELGWAYHFRKPLLCLYHQDQKPSGAVAFVTDTTKSYQNQLELMSLVKEFILEHIQ